MHPGVFQESQFWCMLEFVSSGLVNHSPFRKAGFLSFIAIQAGKTVLCCFLGTCLMPAPLNLQNFLMPHPVQLEKVAGEHRKEQNRPYLKFCLQHPKVFSRTETGCAAPEGESCLGSSEEKQENPALPTPLAALLLPRQVSGDTRQPKSADFEWSFASFSGFWHSLPPSHHTSADPGHFPAREKMSKREGFLSK